MLWKSADTSKFCGWHSHLLGFCYCFLFQINFFYSFIFLDAARQATHDHEVISLLSTYPYILIIILLFEMLLLLFFFSRMVQTLLSHNSDWVALAQGFLTYGRHLCHESAFELQSLTPICSCSLRISLVLNAKKWLEFRIRHRNGSQIEAATWP